MDQTKERLFIGVPLPKALAEHVVDAQAQLPEGPGLRLLGEKQWHFTLAFLGAVDEAKRETVRGIIEAVPADMGGRSSLGGFLMLPSASRARVVALDVDDSSGVLAGLYERVMSSLEEAGIMEREKRPYRPHLTIARLRTPAPVRPRADVPGVDLAVESLCLYRSELKRGGAEYTVVACRQLHEPGTQ